MKESIKKKYNNYKIEKWKDKYINFDLLYKLINDNKEETKIVINEVEENENSKKEFKNLLKKEIKNFFLFYVDIERKLYLKINERLHKMNTYNSLTKKEIINEYNSLYQILLISGNLIAYAYINILIIDDILKKYDQKFENNLYSNFLIEILDCYNSDLAYIFQFKIINEIFIIIDNLINELEILFNTNPLENDSNSSNTIFSTYKMNLEKLFKQIETLYKKVQSINKKWNIIIKNNDNVLTIENDTKSFFSNIISKDNKFNIYISIFQTWFSLFIYTQFYPSLYYILKNENIKLCGLIIGTTYIGEGLSLLIFNYWVKLNFKNPMIYSKLVFISGNIVYYIGSYYQNYFLFFISTFFFGFGSTIFINRNYIINFIPKRKLSTYLKYLKFFSIFGMICGPLIVLINYCLEKTIIKESYTFISKGRIISILNLILSLLELIFIMIFYTEPVDQNFKIYKEGRDPQNLLKKNHFLSLEEQLTYYESKSLKLLDNKLFDLNTENNFNDSNLVSNKVENLLYIEINGKIRKTFRFIIFYMIFISLHIYTFIFIIPFLLDKLYSKNDNFYSSIFFIITFSVYIIIYYIHYFIISRKLSKVFYIILLSIILLIINFLNFFFYRSKDKPNVFIFLTIFSSIIIISKILQDEMFYFFIEIIPTDYKMFNIKALTIIYTVNYLGIILAGISSFFLLKENNNATLILKLIIITDSIIISLLTFSFILLSKKFKKKAIRRILNSRNSRKIKRTEF